MRKLGLKVVGRVKPKEELGEMYKSSDIHMPCGKDVELKWHEDWQGYQTVDGLSVTFNDFSHIDLSCEDFVVRMKVRDLEVFFTTLKTCGSDYYARHDKSGFIVTSDEETGFVVGSKCMSLHKKGDVCNFRFENKRRMYKWVKRLSKCKVWEEN